MASRFIAGLILLGLGFVMVQVSKPYIHSYRFEELVKREVDETRPRAESGAVHRRVLEEGRAMGMLINAEDVQVERLVRGYQVRVHYAVPVDFVVYRTAVDFNFAARTADTELADQ